MKIPRKQRCFAHIGRSYEPCYPPFEAHRKAAMRRHAVLERFEIADERVGIYPALLERCQIRGVRVQTLSPGDQLHAAEQKVERVGARRAPRIRMGVER